MLEKIYKYEDLNLQNKFKVLNENRSNDCCQKKQTLLIKKTRTIWNDGYLRNIRENGREK